MQRRPPDATGRSGEAWAIAIGSASALEPASLAAWLIRCPNAHPYWKWWVARVFELRNLPSVRRHTPKAEYEFVIFAIDPYDCPEPDPENAGCGYPELIPSDVVEQFHGVTDEQAKYLCDVAVKSILDGVLSPDEADQPKWQKRVAMMAECMRGDAHGK